MADLDLPAEIAGRYRPLRVIGRGGMGVVYEAEHLHTGQRLALKVLTRQPGASTERFKREARATSKIQSENIVRITDADVAPELDGAPFLVMELLDGTDLDRATEGNPAAREEVVEWLRQVARALGKAHEAGIIHRDLKPENLFLTRRDDGSPLVKVLDFGIAKVAEGAALTQSDQFLGTPLYMAPEQASSGGTPITPRTDTFALGLIAYRLLTGHCYWKEGTIVQLLAQLLNEPMAPPSSRVEGLGPQFDAWFARACHRDPAERFASAAEEVEALAVALGVPAREITSVNPAPERRISSPRAGSESIATAPTLEASTADVSAARRRPRRAWWWSIAPLVVAGIALAAFAQRGRATATDVREVRVSESADPPRSTPSVAPSAVPPAPSVLTRGSGLDASVEPVHPPPFASGASAPAASVPGKRSQVKPVASIPRVVPSARPSGSAARAPGPLDGQY